MIAELPRTPDIQYVQSSQITGALWPSQSQSLSSGIAKRFVFLHAPRQPCVARPHYKIRTGSTKSAHDTECVVVAPEDLGVWPPHHGAPVEVSVLPAIEGRFSPVDVDLEEFESDALVADFLARHSFLQPSLEKVRAALQRTVPHEKLSLEVDYDHDAPGGEHLVLRAHTTLGSLAALEVLDRFDEEFWLDQKKETKGLLVVTLAFHRVSS